MKLLCCDAVYVRLGQTIVHHVMVSVTYTTAANKATYYMFVTACVSKSKGWLKSVAP